MSLSVQQLREFLCNDRHQRLRGKVDLHDFVKIVVLNQRHRVGKGVIVIQGRHWKFVKEDLELHQRNLHCTKSEII